MSALFFYAQVFLVLVAAASFAALLHALLNAPLDDGTVAADQPGSHQRTRRAEHHHDDDVLHAQLALGEQGGEGFEGGGVGGFHGSKFCLRKPLNTTQQIRGPL